MLAATKILGGHGTLTGKCDQEHPKSFNRVVIDSMELPLQVEVGSDGVKRNQADLEISGPEVHVTSRFVALLGEVASEFVDDDIPLHPSTAAKQRPAPPPFKKDQSGSPSPRRGGAPTATDMAAKITSELATAEVKSIIDAKCILHAGSVVFYSVTAPSHSSESVRNQQQFGGRRSVSFSASNLKHTSSIAARKRANENAAAILDGLASNSNPNATVILRIPLPMLAAYAQGRQGLAEDMSDSTTVRVEVRAENIEVVPAVATLFQEVQYWSKVHAVEFRDRANRVFETVSKMESSATLSKNVFPMHSTILDVALPVPKAFVTQLNATRLALGIEDPSDLLSNSIKSPKSADGYIPPVAKRASDTALHVNITGVRITLSTAPLTSSAVLCTDTEGSIDIIVQMHAPAVGGLSAPRPSFSISPSNRSRVHESTPFPAATDMANTAVTISARRLRLECQGRLEVKCLEMILPECQLLCSIRNSTMSCGEWCKVTTINADVPAVFNQGAGKGSGQCCGPEMTVNASYLHQLFQVIFLWTQKWEEAKQATLLMFRSESNAARGSRNARGSITAAAATKRQNSTRSFGDASSHSRRLTEFIQLTVNVGASASRIDLGSGNKHDFSIAGVRITAKHNIFSTRETMSQCDVALLKTMIRSEGVLSGATTLERCIVKGFIIGNSNSRDEWEAAIDSMLDTTQSFAPGSLEPLRTDEGRTKRLMIRFTDLTLHFKERQLRDLVLFSIGNLVVDVKDGLVRSVRDDADETAALVHVDMSHCVACITPYTSTSFLNVANDVGIILKDQQSKATTKMNESSGSAPSSAQGRGRSGAADQSIRQQSVTPSFVAFDEAEVVSENAADAPLEDEEELIAEVKTPQKRATIGQLNVSIVDATIGLGTVIQVGNLQRGGHAGGSGEGAIVLVPQLSVSFAQSVGMTNLDTPCVKKILVISMGNLELLRPAEKKASIIAFRGSNLIEFFAQHSVDDVDGEREVLYSLMLQQSSPWTGSPRIEDFQAIADVIKSFTHPQNANVLDEFIHVGHIDVGVPPAESPAKAVPPPAAATVKRTLTPIDRKRVRFAPQLRFGRDVSVSVDTILSWLGMREEMIPEKLLDSVCTPLEGLLTTLANQ